VDTSKRRGSIPPEVGMAKKRKTYPVEFKVEAVKVLAESGQSIAQVARDLGIAAHLLSRWRLELQEGAGEAFPGKGRLHPAEAEVEQLRRELNRVKQERDFLRKTAAYFARESE
jgi:transposase